VRHRRRHAEPIDPHELAAHRLDPTLGPSLPVPLPRKRVSPLRLLGYFALAVAVLALVTGNVGRHAPEVDGSCTKPGLAFDRTSVRSQAPVRWAAKGPADARVVIGIDTTALPGTRAEGRLAGPVPLEDCAADGLFGVPVKPGDHVLTAFLVSPDGTARVLRTQRLEVTDP
jgi:hypothetical protein